jgi:DNA repair photolyase
VCYQIKHDFEDIEVKQNAPELLEKVLRSKRKKCMIGTGSMCDPYMHCEEKLGLTRKCLKIIDRYGFGVSLITKSSRVLRDLDLLKSINSKAKAVVQMTLTTYDENLCKILEPYVSTTSERFDALKVLRDNGIPTVVWLCPILPFINDTEENLKGVLKYCFDASVKGIICFGMGVTLREGDREYFYKKLDEHFPGLKEKYHRKYGYAYEVTSDNSPYLMRIFHSECKAHGVISNTSDVFEYLYSFPEEESEQLRLF